MHLDHSSKEAFKSVETANLLHCPQRRRKGSHRVAFWIPCLTTAFLNVVSKWGKWNSCGGVLTVDGLGTVIDWKSCSQRFDVGLLSQKLETLVITSVASQQGISCLHSLDKISSKVFHLTGKMICKCSSHVLWERQYDTWAYVYHFVGFVKDTLRVSNALRFHV